MAEGVQELFNRDHMDKKCHKYKMKGDKKNNKSSILMFKGENNEEKCNDFISEIDFSKTAQKNMFPRNCSRINVLKLRKIMWTEEGT